MQKCLIIVYILCWKSCFPNNLTIFIWLKLCLMSLSGNGPEVLFFSMWRIIRGVIVSVIASIVVDHGFEPWSGQIKENKIGICCFSSNHPALRSKNKDLFALKQDNVSEWSDMSTHRLFIQWDSTIIIS